MNISEILWIIVKYGFIITAIASAIAILFLLFHPLKLNLKLRSTIKGQRAELWFVYLFKLFKIGIVATPHTQDIIVKVAFWKKRLDRQQRIKPTKPDSTPPTDSQTQDSEPPVKVKSSSATPGPSPEEAVSPAVEPSTKPEPSAQKKAKQEKPAPSQDSEFIQKEEFSADTDHQPERDHKTQDLPANEIHSQPKPPTPAQDKKVVKPEQKATKPIVDDDYQSSDSESFRTRLRKIKRNMARKYKQSRYYMRIFMIKWRKLSPVAKKFYTRSKKCLKLEDPNLVVYYALHEPYITGMFQGKLAVLSGAAQGIGFRFEPIPLFGQPTVYARGATTAIIMPWRLVMAFLSLIFEKELRSELWKLVKLLWAKWRNK